MSLNPVWPKVSQEILSKHSRSAFRGVAGKGVKLANSKKVEELLAERNSKAETRHDRGLALEDLGGLTEAANKLADAIFFLYKAQNDPRRDPPLERNRKLILISDLLTVIESYTSELKEKF